MYPRYLYISRDFSQKLSWYVWIYDGVCVLGIQVRSSHTNTSVTRHTQNRSRNCTSGYRSSYHVSRIRTPHSRSGCYAPRESNQALGICDILSAIHIPVRRWVCYDGRRQGYIHDQGVRRTLFCSCYRRALSLILTHTHQCHIECTTMSQYFYLYCS